MSVTPQDQGRPKRKIWRTAALLIGGVALLLMMPGPMIVVILGLFVFVAVVAYTTGPRLTAVAGLFACVILASAHLHWMRGSTLCLAALDYPYLWSMQRTDPDNASGSIENEGGSISISFSLRSTDMIPGAYYAEVIAGPGARVTRLSLGGQRTTRKDTFVGLPYTVPDPIAGTSFFVPQNAQFRASLPFSDRKTDRPFSVVDLPILAEVDEGRFTPVGLLTGEITLGDTAILQPARFGGRNVILDGHRANKSNRADEAYHAEKALDPSLVVDRLHGDWLLLQRASQLRLNRYAAEHDCRPQVYDSWGIGGLFVPRV